MNKEFVPYVEALELKELGFDEPCFGYYNTMGFNRYFDNIKNSDNLIESENIKGNWCTAPLYQQAFRWFKKKYKLWGNIGMQASDYYTLMVYETLPDCCWILYNNKGYETDEEAELACLRKLIEIVKNK